MKIVDSELPIRLVLVDPPAGVDFGVQPGRGAKYETLFVQQRSRRDICFDFSLVVSDNRKDDQHPATFICRRSAQS